MGFLRALLFVHRLRIIFEHIYLIHRWDPNRYYHCNISGQNRMGVMLPYWHGTISSINRGYTSHMQDIHIVSLDTKSLFLTRMFHTAVNYRNTKERDSKIMRYATRNTKSKNKKPNIDFAPDEPFIPGSYRSLNQPFPTLNLTVQLF